MSNIQVPKIDDGGPLEILKHCWECGAEVWFETNAVADNEDVICESCDGSHCRKCGEPVKDEGDLCGECACDKADRDRDSMYSIRSKYLLDMGQYGRK